MVIAAGGVTGLVGLVSPLRAVTVGVQDEVAGPSEPGPLERRASLPTLDAPAPRRVVNVEPAWGPSPFGFRFRVHIVIDAGGRVAEARIPQPVPASTPDGELRSAWMSGRAAVLDAVRQWQFEAPQAAPMLIQADVLVGNVTSAASAGPPRPEAPATAPDALRVGGTVGPPKKLVDVPPVYPDAAKDGGVSGVVIMEITVDREGSVEDARVLRSIPLLDEAALAAVKQWRYAPTWLNGRPVPVIMTVTINFTLSQ
jgi:protein TonB